MNRIILLFFLTILICGTSCSVKHKKLVLSVRNHQLTSYYMPYVIDDPSELIHIKKNKSLMIVDGNGFTIPYQKIDSSKLFFMLNISPAQALKYTFKSTDLEMNFDTIIRCFQKDGDVYWENDKSVYRMHSSKVSGNGGGIDYMIKCSKSFVNKDSLKYYDHYNEGNTLGCGAISPLEDNHLVRYGNFTKMELLDSGPLFLRMRFIFPEIILAGNKVHEERVVSMVPGHYFSKIESQFFGVDSLTVAIGMPLKDNSGNFIDTIDYSKNRFLPISQLGKGYCCFAENFNDGEIGAIFTAVVMDKRQSYKEKIVDGHFLIVAEIKDTSKPFVYYQGAATSVYGMNYDLWQKEVSDFSNKVKSTLTCNLYEVE